MHDPLDGLGAIFEGKAHEGALRLGLAVTETALDGFLFGRPVVPDDPLYFLLLAGFGRGELFAGED